MITEITRDSATEANIAMQKVVDLLSEAEMELEDTLEQCDTLMYGDVPPSPDEEDRGAVVADLLWDARDLRNEADDLLIRIQDFADTVEKEIR